MFDGTLDVSWFSAFLEVSEFHVADYQRQTAGDREMVIGDR